MVMKKIFAFFFFFFFFWSGFFSQTVKILKHSRQQGKGRTTFIPFYHFYQLMNIQKFIFNFACELTTTYFLIASYVFTSLQLRFTTLDNLHFIDY